MPVEGHHQEAAPAPHLLHHRQKLGVDSAEGGVMGVTSELDVVITFLFLSRNSINVTKFRTSHTSEAGSCSRFLTLASVQHFVSLSRGSVCDNERYLSQHVTESVTRHRCVIQRPGVSWFPRCSFSASHSAPAQWSESADVNQCLVLSPAPPRLM